MKNQLIETIVSDDPRRRDRAVEDLLEGKAIRELLRITGELEEFRKSSSNPYHQIRSALFNFAAYRFYLLPNPALPSGGRLPEKGIDALEGKNWEEAIRILSVGLPGRANAYLISALAESYYRLSFHSLLGQVKDAISRGTGNEWLFQPFSLRDYHLKISPAYRVRADGFYPLGFDSCPVRIDPCHSGWSDIFFLAMDFPAGARVINLSVDIAPRGRGRPRPPVECFSRILDQPVIRLTSLDLEAQEDFTSTSSLFNLSGPLALLQAGIIASGLVPPSLESKVMNLNKILARLAGAGRGLELITRVRDLPTGSRLAVSTALLNTIITRLMRMTGQLTPAGGLNNQERFLVMGRTILGEWLGGSGGGWQDSGGLWPGIKILKGVRERPGYPESGLTRGRLLPRVEVFPSDELPPGLKVKLASSMILFHGGMGRDVGPVLEMVTEKYFLRYRKEWVARQRETGYFRGIVQALRRGDFKELGRLTQRDWEKGTKVIMPEVTNPYTESLIRRMKEKWKKDYWGFLLLGGTSGGGMAFFVNPRVREDFIADLRRAMRRLQRRYAAALPFARPPLVFDFSLNSRGIQGRIFRGKPASLPRKKFFTLNSPKKSGEKVKKEAGPAYLKERFGFDPRRQREIKRLLREGKIGIARNRLPGGVRIEDVRRSDLLTLPASDSIIRRGKEALREGEAAVVTLSGGVGSRWSGGRGMVKALNPRIFLQGRHRSFLEIHLGRSHFTGRRLAAPSPHVFTTSFLTHQPIKSFLRETGNCGYPGPVYLSRGVFMARRLYPPARELRFFYRDKIQRIRDNKKKRFLSARLHELIRWAEAKGEMRDYNENPLPQRFYPPGHYYEIQSLILNHTLTKLLRDHPSLKYLLVHNLDTLGAGLDPALLGLHISSGRTISFEVAPRRWGDRGGFLARVNGKTRLVEEPALPRPEENRKLSNYNSLTSWVSIDPFLNFLGLNRSDLQKALKNRSAGSRVSRSLAHLESELPTYVTFKEVSQREGSGGMKTLPLLQCEKLWGDITALKGLEFAFLLVNRFRAQQLKNPRHLDHWIRDGSLKELSQQCDFT